jgi:hypothetical protein
LLTRFVLQRNDIAHLPPQLGLLHMLQTLKIGMNPRLKVISIQLPRRAHSSHDVAFICCSRDDDTISGFL